MIFVSLLCEVKMSEVHIMKHWSST